MAMTALKERPIIFTAEMVRALLAGRKTQTRRPVKPMPGEQSRWLDMALLHKAPRAVRVNDGVQLDHPKGGPLTWVKCPYGKPGDRLWVREAYKLAKQYDHLKPGAIPFGEQVTYLADDTTTPATWRLPEAVGKRRWDKAMPRWASRLTLEITGVRVERVQAITEADALAEGVEPIRGIADPHDASKNYTYYPDYRPPVDHINVCSNAKTSFMTMWQSMYSPDPVKGWDANPWVWVVSFKRVEAPRV